MKKKTLILSISIFILAAILIFSLGKFFFRSEQAEQSHIRIAIVLDDWGYNLDYTNLMRKIDAPLTLSVLPDLRYSARVCRIADKLGQRVILHLPLEPERDSSEIGIGLEKGTITADMSLEEIRNNFNRALESVSYAKGISNHMGSRATTDRRVMTIIFKELQKRDFFFMDNVVTEKSICRKLAKKMAVKFVSRDVFLDNSDEPEYIEGQFEELVELARRKGQAVGVGHARPETLKVLREKIKAAKEEGIRFIFIEELAK